MEEIISQRFVFAEIIPYKNYCKISDRDLYVKNIKSSDTEEYFISDYSLTPTVEFNSLTSTVELNRRRPIFLKPKRKNRKTKYFHGNGEEEIIHIDYGTPKINTYNPFITTKERHIKKHYGNAFSEIRVQIIERSIRIKNNKITIKVYRRTKRRDLNWIYFKSSNIIHSITLDLSSGNFTTVNINNGVKIIRRNSFSQLNTMVSSNELFGLQPPGYLLRNNRDELINEFKSIFSEDKFSSAINQTLDFTFSNYSKDKRMFIKFFLNKFIELKKIKTPNDFEFLLVHFYPTEKFLKKNDRKLIASILDFFNIKSKITIKLLHKNPKIDIYTIVNLCKIFGCDYQKYIGNIDDDLILKNYSEVKGNNEILSKGFIGNIKFNFLIKDIEKDILLKLINSLPKDNFILDRKFIGLLIDHFNMINTVRTYDPDYILRAKNYNDLHIEHTELSKIITAINKGWVIEYNFNQEMVTEIEKPITVDIDMSDSEIPIIEHITFKPYLLKREEDYIEEGNFMHHCVASYSDKDRSVIVSIRNDDMSDRITCEFDCQTGICIQAKHFCNALPPGDMELALDKLKEKIKHYSRLGMLHSTEKKKVPVKINGVEIVPEIPHPIFNDHLFGN